MLLDDLNLQQREAVKQIEGAVMIIAGAGSGKTRTLTYKIAYLLEQGISPYNILALTFTNKAAEEMKERIIDLTGNTAKSILMGTFHSVFARILRLEADRLGYVRNFTIYDTDDSKSVIKSIVKEKHLDEKLYSPSFILDRISKAKNNLFSSTDYLNNTELLTEDRMVKRPEIANIYKEYNFRLRRAMAMDFDDLLFNLNVLLRDCPDILDKYQQRFKYIMVDEYQDTNYSQYLIIKKLSSKHGNICVVGDDAQSIYSFRGATIRNILNFKKDYKNATIYKLEQNYRSTQNIVNAANSVIANNENQISKEVWTENEYGRKINYMNLDSDREEAFYICSAIRQRIEEEYAHYKHFAVLYRTNMQSRALEEALRLRNIPYRLYGGISFYARKEIKDILAYFRLVSNNNDNEAFLRIINYPARGIGNTTINRLKLLAAEQNTSLFNVSVQLNTLPSDINKATRDKIVEFCRMISSYSKLLDTENALNLGEEIIRFSGIKIELHKEETIEAEEKINNIEELINSLQSFVFKDDDILIDELTGEEIYQQNRTLTTFLSQVSLMTDADMDLEDNDKVVLMTIHAAKGLEFPYVFIAGMEENLFPSMLSLTSRADTEEERRLFYVAITRAQKELLITSARMRFRYGELVFSEHSRFIDEIDPEYLSQPLHTKKAFPAGNLNGNSNSNTQNTKKPILTLKKKSVSSDSKLELPKPIGGVPAHMLNKYEVGQQVVHASFGKGIILILDGEGDSRKAVVEFEDKGKKTLILRFAKLEIL
ncbi:MAG: UvrD-helicase domain-containing protein [Bacteroidales bacterium]|jgi:DNA helicase-2/ATP-dependent DNA helicase PcrA|nr:UvrD-helicase domain-containing protein [Bacteroidales bacterium]